MATELPLWFGRERGTDLTALVEWDDPVEEGDGGGIIDDFAAGLLGLLAPVAFLALIVGTASLPIMATAALVGVAILWLGGGIASAVIVGMNEDGAPCWAAAFARVLIVTGKIIAFGTVVTVVLIGLAMLLGVIIAALASDSR